MELYAERNASLPGGCLSRLVQMTILFRLFYTIKEFENLQDFRNGGRPWFKDLTVADPYFVLSVIFALAMMAAREITLGEGEAS